MARPKAFDQAQALEKAMQQFWTYGYEATSIQDLLDCMGINRGSLYATFGDKHALFMAALEHYFDAAMNPMLALLEGPDPGLEAIAQVFDAIAQAAADDKQLRGCFMTNTAVALLPEDKQLRNTVNGHFLRIQQAFHRALLRAQQAGAIAKRPDLAELAQYLLTSVQGLLVMRKTTHDLARLRSINRITLSILK